MSFKVAKRLTAIGLVLILMGDFGLGSIATVLGSGVFLVGVRSLSQFLKMESLTMAFTMPVILQLTSAVLALVVAGKSIPILTKVYENLLNFESVEVTNWYSWFVPSLILITVLTIAVCVFFARAYKMLAEATNIKVFLTTSKLYKWSAILFIVVVGAFIMIFAQILAIVGFLGMQIKQDGNVS